MKTSIGQTFLTFIFLTALASACTSTPTPAAISLPITPSPIPSKVIPSPIPPTSTPEPTSTVESILVETPSSSPIPITITPFYYSEGIQIDVGNYSQELKTNDLHKLTLVAQEMAQQKETLTPEQMFVLSIRLYDLGDKDSSVYWFYEARFRQQLFKKSLDPSHIGGMGAPSFELPAAYNAFSQLAGDYINAYAGCDLDKWINVANTVGKDNPKPPDLEKLFPGVVFIERSQWQQINDEVAAGLDDLAKYISENREDIKNQRAANNLDAL